MRSRKRVSSGLSRLVAVVFVSALDLVSATASSVVFLGCATYSNELTRAQRAYEQGEDERALGLLRALEPDVERLTTGERARYSYLRGMTDYRLGYRADARHWLAWAGAVEKNRRDSLSPDWSATLADTLNELNVAVYRAGIASLFDADASTVRATASVIEAADESSGILGPAAAPTSDGGL